MRHLRRKAGPLAAGAALALALTACGGDDEPATEDTPAAEQTENSAESEMDESPAESESPAEEDTGQASGFAEGEPSGNPFADTKIAADYVGENSAPALAGGLVEAGAVEGDVSTPAVQAYVSLSQLLQEHVYLAGYAVDAAFSFGPDSQEFELAAATLDENSVALADLVGSVAPDQRDAFLSLWREHIGFFVDYAVAAAGGDEEGKQEAISNLDGYRQQAGAFFEEITGGELPADAVAASLDEHVATVTAAIDALAANDPSAFEKLKAAADHVGENGAAKTLAGGIAAAAGLEGDIDSSAAGALASLTTLLEEHVYLTGIGIKTAFATGADSEATAAALEGLDVNTQDLANVVGSVAPDQQEAFASLWREHIGFFVDYAVGVRTGDQATADEALTNLSGYGQQAGAFFEQISGGAIPASAVQGSLSEHVRTTTAAIQSLNQAVPQG